MLRGRGPCSVQVTYEPWGGLPLFIDTPPYSSAVSVRRSYMSHFGTWAHPGDADFVILAKAGIQRATTRGCRTSNSPCGRSQPNPANRVALWILAFARMSASVMLPCQEGKSPSDVKS